VDYSVADEICVTAGATEAVYVAIQSFITPGDEVIILEPAFDIYAAAVVAAGGIPIFVKLIFPDFSIDWESVEKAINKNTKLLIMNSPHNPTGAVISQSDIDVLEHLVQKYQLHVLSDEVYEHIVFDGEIHHSVLRSDILRERSFVVFSLGKTLHVTGWRLGYCLAPKRLMDKFKNRHQFVTFSAATPLQLACAEYLKDEHTYLGLPTFFQQKRNYFLKEMEGTGFESIPTRGTYFQLMSYKNLSEESDIELAKRLTIEKKVATIPISVFYHDATQHHILRFCFAKELGDLHEAAASLKI
jgi:methionine aminotransferase